MQLRVWLQPQTEGRSASARHMKVFSLSHPYLRLLYSWLEPHSSHWTPYLATLLQWFSSNCSSTIWDPARNGDSHPTSDPLNQRLWRWESAICILISPIVIMKHTTVWESVFRIDIFVPRENFCTMNEGFFNVEGPFPGIFFYKIGLRGSLQLIGYFIISRGSKCLKETKGPSVLKDK